MEPETFDLKSQKHNPAMSVHALERKIQSIRKLNISQTPILVRWQMLSEPEIVRVQLAREQYRVTIPKEIAQKLKLKKGQPLWMTVQGEKIILEPVKR